MNDRELLEMAAKAAGIVINMWTEPDYYSPRRGEVAEVFGQDIYNEWNPLTDDGDALQLAVKLRMHVEPWGSGASAVVYVDNRALVSEPHYGDDAERATRRAIVRAAAGIGKAMNA